MSKDVTKLKTEEDVKKEILKICKESVEDVYGWKKLIFLPQSFAWQVLILFTVYTSFSISTFKFFYSYNDSRLDMIMLSCDFLYLFDVVCATTHVLMVKTRSRRYGKKRPIYFLFTDYISLVPFNMAGTYLIYTENESAIQNLRLLQMNVALRLYRVFTSFRDIKVWIKTVRIYFLLVFFELLTYVLLMGHLLSCIVYIFLDENSKKKCSPVFFCMVQVELMALGALAQSYMDTLSSVHLEPGKLVISVIYLAGFIYTYAYMLPVLLFTAMKFFRGFFEFSFRCKQLQKIIENYIDGKELKEKTIECLQYVWIYGKGDRWPSIMKEFPLSYQKNIFTDMHWEAFRHSDFLECLSLGCKRTLSLYMSTEFIQPNTILVDLMEEKSTFIYLSTGLIQIMAEENNTSPVATFSSGTVVGETSLFLHTKSKAILRTAKFCEIHVLTFKNFYRALLYYPRDMKKVFSKMKFRLKIAKATQNRKKEICPLFLSRTDFGIVRVHANIKWIKQQYRALFKLAAATEASKKEAEKERRNLHYHLKTQLDHTSSYIYLLSINDEIAKRYDAVCLKITFPCVLDPYCNFLQLWKKIILIQVVIASLFFPAMIGWVPNPPLWFYDLSVVINFFYVIDVLLQLTTAVRIKHTVQTDFSGILISRLKNLEFYLDILAAIPLQTIGVLFQTSDAPYQRNIFFSNQLAKVYKMIHFVNEWNYSVKPGIIWRTLIKYLFLLNLAIYWLSAVLKLISIECVFYQCNDNDWYIEFEAKEGSRYRDYASVFLGVFVGLSMPHDFFHTGNIYTYIVYHSAFWIFRLGYIMWYIETISVFVLNNSSEFNYKNLANFVAEFMYNNRVVPRIQKRVMRMMGFQWAYDYGDWITHEHRIMDELSPKLRQEIDRRTLLPTIKGCKLFKNEEDYFYLNLCKKVHRLAVPAKSVLFTFGNQTMNYYLVHRGFVQLNSFLPNDINQNIGASIILSRGDAFPVLAAFSQLPSVVTARTLTDCELIIMDVEDIISQWIVCNILKDVVVALKSTDVSSFKMARLALTGVPDIFKFEKKSYLAAFLKFGICKTCISGILLKKAIDSKNAKYIKWEFTRVLVIVVSVFLWPFIYGVYTKSENKQAFIYLLLMLDLTFYPDFYIRLHLAYYNRYGIYVTHPLATSKHYITSAFIVDFVSFLPHLHYIFACLIMRKQLPDIPLFLVHVLMRSLSIYRFFGIISHVDNLNNNMRGLTIFKFLVISLLLMNASVNYILHWYLNGEFSNQFRISMGYTFDENKWNYYINEYGIAIAIMARLPFLFENYDVTNIIYIICMGLFGWVIRVLIFAFLTSRSTSNNQNFMIYQHYMKSFVKYLNNEKIEDDIRDQAIEHFEHEWKQKKGENISYIFSRFPNVLHEDLMFPLYKNTLGSVPCLAGANEAFYRELSRNLFRVYLRKGSTIIFRHQVQEFIYFVHKGSCIVKNNARRLYKGAMIGDIKRNGRMVHTINANTHVDLLRINSTIFFLIMNNFFETKVAFDYEVERHTDFVESDYIQYYDDENEELFKVEDKTLEESSFEPEYGRDTYDESFAKTRKHKRIINRLKEVINPTSKKAQLLQYIFVADSIATLILVPYIMGLKYISVTVFSVIYVLDFIWLLKIIVTARTGYLNVKTGNIISNGKVIMKNYCKRIDGLVPDILCIIPIELITFYLRRLNLGTQELCYVSCFSFTLRLLRWLYLQYFLNKQKKKLSSNFFWRWIVIVGSNIIIINFFTNINLIIASDPRMAIRNCSSILTNTHWEALSWSYMCTVSTYSGSGMFICLYDNYVQTIFEIIVGMWAFIANSFLINQVLTIVYVLFYTNSDRMHKLHELEKYLMARDVSPFLLNQVRNYFCAVTEGYKEGPMPSFLKNAPDCIKISIMKDIYYNHINKCFLFKNLPEIFKAQLTMRLERQVYFPGDYITEKGDVDQCMYFVHRGEVYCLEYDELYPGLEKIVDVFKEDESFEELQGIYMEYPHNYTYRAKTLTEIMILNFKTWEDLRIAFPDVTKQLYTHNKSRGFETEAEVIIHQRIEPQTAA